MSVLGLHCCTQAFSNCGEGGYSLPRMPELLMAMMVSLVAEQGFWAPGLSSCCSWAQLLHGLWDLQGPGMEQASASQGRAPGKPSREVYSVLYSCYTRIYSCYTRDT